MRKDSGFTLIELMVAISVLAILISVGVPSMLDFVRNNRRAAAVNSLVSDIQRARSNAASAGVDTILCHSTNGTACSGATNPDWADGWILFGDTNDNDAFDAASEQILSSQAARNGVTMPSSSGNMEFRPGFRVVVGNGTVAVCVDGADNDRWIIVSGAGRPRLQNTIFSGVAC